MKILQINIKKNYLEVKKKPHKPQKPSKSDDVDDLDPETLYTVDNNTDIPVEKDENDSPLGELSDDIPKIDDSDAVDEVVSVKNEPVEDSSDLPQNNDNALKAGESTIGMDQAYQTAIAEEMSATISDGVYGTQLEYSLYH